MGKLFGTDGVRGVANKDLTCEMGLKIGVAVARTLKKEMKKKTLTFQTALNFAGKQTIKNLLKH